MKEIIGFITITLTIFGYIPYLSDVIKKRTKPHLFSWLTWTIVAGLVFLGQLSAGAAAGAWSAGVVTTMAVLITLFTLRSGVKTGNILDKISLIAALTAIIPWYLTKNPLLSIVIATFIDFAALLPTVRKTVNQPRGETPSMYTLNIIRQMLVLLAMGQYNLTTVIYPVYSIITNSLMTTIITKPKRGYGVERLQTQVLRQSGFFKRNAFINKGIRNLLIIR